MTDFFAIVAVTKFVEIEAESYKEAVKKAQDVADGLNITDPITVEGLQWGVEAVQLKERSYVVPLPGTRP